MEDTPKKFELGLKTCAVIIIALLVELEVVAIIMGVDGELRTWVQSMIFIKKMITYRLIQ